MTYVRALTRWKLDENWHGTPARTHLEHALDGSLEEASHLSCRRFSPRGSWLGGRSDFQTFCWRHNVHAFDRRTLRKGVVGSPPNEVAVGICVCITRSVDGTGNSCSTYAGEKETKREACCSVVDGSVSPSLHRIETKAEVSDMLDHGNDIHTPD
ncbi:hypothetical protein CLAIMM_02406 isoform 2 [Cladophialophora immunda]|nr:hypothetical protein CLAIMM_02406 isoform 2 [Cladophialophora immunda]